MARGGDGLYQGGRTWRGAVLAGLVIALPAQAAAECAWVIWAWTKRLPGGRRRSLFAGLRAQDCFKVQRREADEGNQPPACPEGIEIPLPPRHG
jgi:hypothetical protein